MNRQDRRALAVMADRENRRWPAHLVQLSRETWIDRCADMTIAPIEVWRSSALLVQVYPVPEDEYVLRMSVQRAEESALRRAQGQGHQTNRPISWDELQEAKRQIGRGEQAAVELYPPESATIAHCPMRHLWLLPEPPAWTWRR